MRAIAKGRNRRASRRIGRPQSCDYDNYADKDALRHALVTEQRGICCYCMGRIHNGSATMKIEHWRCQSRYPDEQLNYRNLLGACRGGDEPAAAPPALRHAQRRPRSQWNPADPAHHIETRLITSSMAPSDRDDADSTRQLNDVLNLNLTSSRTTEKRIRYAILEWWQREKAGLQAARSFAIALSASERTHDGAGELAPFCQVAVWWLRSATREDDRMSDAPSFRGSLRDRHRGPPAGERLRPPLTGEGFDRERAIFPETVLAFIRETQPKEWAKLEALHGEQDRRAGPRRPVQVDGRERLAGDAAPRLQVLRADAARGLLQGRARAEPGAGGALRGEPPRAHPAAALLAALGEVARCHA